MMENVLKAAGEASLSAGVMILAVLVLRAWFQDRTPRRAFCLLWDMVLVRLLVLGALVLCTASLVDASYNPFLYFRF